MARVGDEDPCKEGDQAAGTWDQTQQRQAGKTDWTTEASCTGPLLTSVQVYLSQCLAEGQKEQVILYNYKTGKASYIIEAGKHAESTDMPKGYKGPSYDIRSPVSWTAQLTKQATKAYMSHSPWS